MKKRKPKVDWGAVIAAGIVLIGVAAIGLSTFLKTEEGKKLNTKSIEELEFEMVQETESENYEKAALIRDLIKQKQLQ